MLAPDVRRQLAALLEDARRRGMIGPGPVEAHLDHAEALAAAVDPDFHGRFLDLGSGATRRRQSAVARSALPLPQPSDSP